MRNAEEEDAKNLINYVKTIAEETPFLIREPDEFSLTVEQERNFICGLRDNPKALMLIAEMNGKHIGNCSVNRVGTYRRRYAHCCEVSVALYQK